MIIFYFNGFIEDGQSLSPFLAHVSEPVMSLQGDHYCTIHAPYLFEYDKEIYGATAVQAKQLALNFLRSLIGGRALYDKDGRPFAFGDG